MRRRKVIESLGRDGVPGRYEEKKGKKARELEIERRDEEREERKEI